jgi:hypothetical protein
LPFDLGYAVVAETLVPILKEILRTPAKDGGKRGAD